MFRAFAQAFAQAFAVTIVATALAGAPAMAVAPKCKPSTSASKWTCTSDLTTKTRRGMHPKLLPFRTTHQPARNVVRTTPLWGVRTPTRY